MIRILAGTLRSRQITTPSGSATRPTSSQIRASVFNITQHLIEGATFLDICAGSGAMGLEALSRGAKSCQFIEEARNAVVCIKENISRFALDDACKVHSGDALGILPTIQGPFDICYFDPPYTKEKGQLSNFTHEVLTLFDKTPALLAAGGYLFLEESGLANLTKFQPTHLTLENARRYGDSTLYCFKSKKVI